MSASPLLDTKQPSLSAEHSGLTAQAAIQESEAAAKQAREKAPDSLVALKMRVLAASTNGVLQADIRSLVEENRQQAVQRVPA